MDVKRSASEISATLKGKGIPEEFCKLFEGELTVNSWGTRPSVKYPKLSQYVFLARICYVVE